LLWPEAVVVEYIFSPVCECPMCGSLHTPVVWLSHQDPQLPGAGERWATDPNRRWRTTSVCSVTCRRAIERRRDRIRRPRGSRIRRCQVCDANFTARRADARHCSAACRQKAYRDRGSLRSRAAQSWG